MAGLIERLEKKGLIHPPKWLSCNTQYVTIMGSHCYGVADTSVKDKLPDFDIYGWSIEPVDMIFPSLKGEVPGFGRQQQKFGVYQQHHIMEKDAPGGNNVAKEWDLNIYGIVKYFELCRNNNPNMIDSMWTPENCVLHCTQVGRMVRDARRDFIGKIAWKRFRGYAWGQLKKAQKCLGNKETDYLVRFENDHNIPRTTSLKDVEKEMKKRGLKI